MLSAAPRYAIESGLIPTPRDMDQPETNAAKIAAIAVIRIALRFWAKVAVVYEATDTSFYSLLVDIDHDLFTQFGGSSLLESTTLEYERLSHDTLNRIL